MLDSIVEITTDAKHTYTGLDDFNFQNALYGTPLPARQSSETLLSKWLYRERAPFSPELLTWKVLDSKPISDSKIIIFIEQVFCAENELHVISLKISIAEQLCLFKIEITVHVLSWCHRLDLIYKNEMLPAFRKWLDQRKGPIISC